MRIILVLSAALAATSCQSNADEAADRTDRTTRPDAPETRESTVVSSSAPQEQLAEPLRFTGRWAATVEDCEELAWDFTADTLDTPAGSHCDFEEVREVPGGYDIAATCTAEGPPAEEAIELRFAESADAMLFNSESIADAGLVECGG